MLVRDVKKTIPHRDIAKAGVPPVLVELHAMDVVILYKNICKVAYMNKRQLTSPFPW
jgi:hypothetical protein